MATSNDYFINEDVNKKFLFWINNYPLSFHQLDMDRFTQFVISLLDNNEEMVFSTLKESLMNVANNTEEWIADTYWTKYSAMRDMYNMLKLDNKLK